MTAVRRRGWLVWLVGGVMVPGLAAQPRLDLSAEWVTASDVDLGQVGGTWRWADGAHGLTGEVSLAGNTFAIDYAPVAFDFRGEARTVRADSGALQASVRWRRGETWEWLAAAGVHSGFTNYRALWLAEYFRQQFEPLGTSVPGDGWEKADPKGASLSLGGRWEYVRASGYLEVVVTGLRDTVAPGYEIDFEGLHRGRTRLAGEVVTVSSENILSPRLRSRLEVRASQLTDRAWRWGGEAALNAALGERLVLRLALGGATESPRFHAWYAALTADWAWSDHLGLFVEGRTYVDTGEIENALLFTSAAPGLHSRQGGGGLRWRGDRTTWRLAVAGLHSDQDPTNPRLDFFQNLYRDRHWTVLQLSYTREL